LRTRHARIDIAKASANADGRLVHKDGTIYPER
jgi:hypothetical protein